MKIKKILFDFWIHLIKIFVRLFGERNKNQILSNMVEQLVPIYSSTTQYGKILFYAVGELPLWRAETLLTKEPETIEWINTFAPSELMWDIGANIGCYSLYAATKGQQVVAFEPSAVNYHILNKNVQLNNLENNIQALCMAFSNVSMVGYLNMTNVIPGGAMNTFGEKIDSFKLMRESYIVSFRQGMISFSIDDFINFYNFPCPNHIKIDVDGNENKIISGATKTLRDRRLKSLLIELDTSDSDYQAIIRTITECGLKLISKKHENEFCGIKGADVYNHIFMRDLQHL
jgi:FkbM family methyltransferase